jgi:hypothetical protein
MSVTLRSRRSELIVCKEGRLVLKSLGGGGRAGDISDGDEFINTVLKEEYGLDTSNSVRIAIRPLGCWRAVLG